MRLPTDENSFKSKKSDFVGLKCAIALGGLNKC